MLLTMTDEFLPSHVQEKPEGGRTRLGTTVRSYVLEVPFRRFVEGYRLYACLLDDIYGMDWKKVDGDKVPPEKKAQVRGNLAKSRASVVRVALETLQYVEKQADLMTDTQKSQNVIPAELAKEGEMDLEAVRKNIEEDKKLLKGLEIKEKELVVAPGE